ncbi:MAG: Ldh family oxidoreductase [Chloroflexi bacterium]|nr:Ldh family oxidoreductase [Chloroflexota bacterium]
MANDDTIIVSATQLENLIAEIFVRLGVPAEDAAYQARILVDADLRGIDTHGALLVPYYVKKIQNRLINLRPQMKVIKETPTTLVLDGDNGLGHITAAKAMERCIIKAKESGVALVGLRNTNHVGCMGYYVIQAVEKDLIGYIVTDTHANLAPWGGKVPMLGNNPFAVGIPAGEELPIVLDMAISVAAKAKVIKAAAQGRRIPEGWVVDANTGESITDPEVIVGPLEKRKEFLLQPIGGPKGYGMLVVNTILAGILTGTENFGPYLPAFGSQFTKVQHLGVFMAVVDITAFTPLDEFKAKVDDLICKLKSSERLPGVEEIFLPGEIEYRTKQRRLVKGIPVLRETWQNLQSISQSLSK